MTILLSGGGTGGHITPILAVAKELKRLDPACRVVYVGERAGKFAHLISGNASIDVVYTVFAGKFRRYHSETWWQRLLDIRTNLLNIRDFFYFIIGRLQAGRLLAQLQPDIVFLKGGFVGVPVGLAAGRRGIPIVTHDSDALPGLANRLVSRYVAVHATALPAVFYPYPATKVLQVGVIVDDAFQHVTGDLQHQYKKQLEVSPLAQVLLITGGSSGAMRINQAVAKIIESLLQTNLELIVFHQVGRGKGAVYENFQHERLHVLEFLSPMHVYTGAADVIVCRASGNTLAELGVQGKPCIVVPSPYLAGGHQLKNAEQLIERRAAVVLQENELDADPNKLLDAIQVLLSQPDQRRQLSEKLNALVIPDAAKRLASLLIEKAHRVSQKTK